MLITDTGILYISSIRPRGLGIYRNSMSSGRKYEKGEKAKERKKKKERGNKEYKFEFVRAKEI